MQEERAELMRVAVQTKWDSIGQCLGEFASLLFRKITEIDIDVAKIFPLAKDETLRCVVSGFLFVNFHKNK